MSARYVVVDVNPNNVVSRPQVVDQTTGRVVTVGALNDWDRLERFASELNEIEDVDREFVEHRDGLSPGGR